MMESKRDLLQTGNTVLHTQVGLDGEIMKSLDTMRNVVKESFIYGHPLEKNLKNAKYFEYNQMIDKVGLAVGDGFCKQLEMERSMLSSVQRMGGLPSSRAHLQRHLSIENTIKPYDYLKGPFHCDFNNRDFDF